MIRPRMTWLLPLVAAVCACDDAPREALTSCQQVQILAAPVKTDILFVVDDSPSMADSQANLATNFQAFVDRLWNSPVENDFQIGVTTSAVHRYLQGPPASYPATFANSGSSGSPCHDLLTYLPAGDINYPAGGLVSVTAGPDPATQRIQSVTGTSPPRILLADSTSLVTDFTENVKVGVCGSFKEQGLEAARLAIQKAVPGGVNEGFLRPGARLAVIIVTDSDDCSDPEMTGTDNYPTACTSYDVQEYINFFQGALGGEARHVVVGAIIAADPVSGAVQGCAEADLSGALEDPVRYKAFAQAFGSSAIVGNVCDASFHDTLENIAGLIDPGQTMPLSGTPPDPQLMSVRVNKADGSTVNCQVGVTGDPAANAIYLEPSASDPARLTFRGACTLQQGDRVEVNILCAE